MWKLRIYLRTNIWKAPHKNEASDWMCSIYTLKRQRYLLTLLYAILRKARIDRLHKNKAINVICLVFVWTVLGALSNNACKQSKVSTFASLMCKSCKLCHLPYFCVEPSIYISIFHFYAIWKKILSIFLIKCLKINVSKTAVFIILF